MILVPLRTRSSQLDSPQLCANFGFAALVFNAPFPPMGRPHVDPLLAFRVDPPGENAPACENERMRPVPIEDSKLEVAVERRGRNGLPHGFLIGRGAGAALIWIKAAVADCAAPRSSAPHPPATGK